MADTLKNMSEDNLVFNVTSTTFPTLVIDRSRDVPVVVDFWAAWCGPCQVLMPMLARLAQEYQGKFALAKVNTDQERELAQRYGVRNLPTVKIFRHGKVVEEFMGAQPEKVVRSYLDRHVDQKAGQLRQQAAAACEQGNFDDALVNLRRAIELEPANKAIQLDLARLFLTRNELREAESILSAFQYELGEAEMLISYLELVKTARDTNHQTLEAFLAANPLDHDARYCLATTQLIAKNYLEAIENLLEIVRRDRKFRDDGARKALLTIFAFLGADNQLVVRYRKRLVNLLH
ncbi:putative thioredoxin [Gammaproteobacteria bacterium]